MTDEPIRFNLDIAQARDYVSLPPIIRANMWKNTTVELSPFTERVSVFEPMSSLAGEAISPQQAQENMEIVEEASLSWIDTVTTEDTVVPHTQAVEYVSWSDFPNTTVVGGGNVNAPNTFTIGTATTNVVQESSPLRYIKNIGGFFVNPSQIRAFWLATYTDIRRVGTLTEIHICITDIGEVVIRDNAIAIHDALLELMPQ